MTATLRLACLQTSPGDDMASNLAIAVSMTRAAAGDGAQLVALPEYAVMLHASGRTMRERALDETRHPALEALAATARDTGCWILVGSLTVRTDEERIANRSYLLSADGEIVARYDKVHMFDATLPSGRVIRESSTYRPGCEAVVAATPWGAVGLSICYDLRFPQLYRALAQAGAAILFVPSAFAQSTGALHWHALLRARAIENASFVIAPATCGTHPGNHATYGHSLVVDPMGSILADGGELPTIVVADLELTAIDRARAMLPCLTQDRDFAKPRSVATIH
jgi:predicted amidohydrolase